MQNSASTQLNMSSSSNTSTRCLSESKKRTQPIQLTKPSAPDPSMSQSNVWTTITEQFSGPFFTLTHHGYILPMEDSETVLNSQHHESTIPNESSNEPPIHQESIFQIQVESLLYSHFSNLFGVDKAGNAFDAMLKWLQQYNGAATFQIVSNNDDNNNVKFSTNIEGTLDGYQLVMHTITFTKDNGACACSSPLIPGLSTATHCHYNRVTSNINIPMASVGYNGGLLSQLVFSSLFGFFVPFSVVLRGHVTNDHSIWTDLSLCTINYWESKCKYAFSTLDNAWNCIQEPTSIADVLLKFVQTCGNETSQYNTHQNQPSTASHYTSNNHNNDSNNGNDEYPFLVGTSCHEGLRGIGVNVSVMSYPSPENARLELQQIRRYAQMLLDGSGLNNNITSLTRPISLNGMIKMVRQVTRTRPSHALQHLYQQTFQFMGLNYGTNSTQHVKYWISLYGIEGHDVDDDNDPHNIVVRVSLTKPSTVSNIIGNLDLHAPPQIVWIPKSTLHTLDISSAAKRTHKGNIQHACEIVGVVATSSIVLVNYSILSLQQAMIKALLYATTHTTIGNGLRVWKTTAWHYIRSITYCTALPLFSPKASFHNSNRYNNHVIAVDTSLCCWYTCFLKTPIMCHKMLHTLKLTFGSYGGLCADDGAYTGINTIITLGRPPLYEPDTSRLWVPTQLASSSTPNIHPKHPHQTIQPDSVPSPPSVKLENNKQSTDTAQFVDSVHFPNVTIWLPYFDNISPINTSKVSSLTSEKSKSQAKSNSTLTPTGNIWKSSQTSLSSFASIDEEKSDITLVVTQQCDSTETDDINYTNKYSFASSNPNYESCNDAHTIPLCVQPEKEWDAICSKLHSQCGVRVMVDMQRYMKSKGNITIQDVDMMVYLLPHIVRTVHFLTSIGLLFQNNVKINHGKDKHGCFCLAVPNQSLSPFTNGVLIVLDERIETMHCAPNAMTNQTLITAINDYNQRITARNMFPFCSIPVVHSIESLERLLAVHEHHYSETGLESCHDASNININSPIKQPMEMEMETTTPFTITEMTLSQSPPKQPHQPQIYPYENCCTIQYNGDDGTNDSNINDQIRSRSSSSSSSLSSSTTSLSLPSTNLINFIVYLSTGLIGTVQPNALNERLQYMWTCGLIATNISTTVPTNIMTLLVSPQYKQAMLDRTLILLSTNVIHSLHDFADLCIKCHTYGLSSLIHIIPVVLIGSTTDDEWLVATFKHCLSSMNTVYINTPSHHSCTHYDEGAVKLHMHIRHLASSTYTIQHDHYPSPDPNCDAFIFSNNKQYWYKRLGGQYRQNMIWIDRLNMSHHLLLVKIRTTSESQLLHYAIVNNKSDTKAMMRDPPSNPMAIMSEYMRQLQFYHHKAKMTLFCPMTIPNGCHPFIMDVDGIKGVAILHEKTKQFVTTANHQTSNTNYNVNNWGTATVETAVTSLDSSSVPSSPLTPSSNQQLRRPLNNTVKGESASVTPLPTNSGDVDSISYNIARNRLRRQHLITLGNMSSSIPRMLGISENGVIKIQALSCMEIILTNQARTVMCKLLLVDIDNTALKPVMQELGKYTSQTTNTSLWRSSLQVLMMTSIGFGSRQSAHQFAMKSTSLLLSNFGVPITSAHLHHLLKAAIPSSTPNEMKYLPSTICLTVDEGDKHKTKTKTVEEFNILVGALLTNVEMVFKYTTENMENLSGLFSLYK